MGRRRRRGLRELSIAVGIVGILGAIAIANDFVQRGGKFEYFEKVRAEAEQSRADEGFQLINWSLMRSTRGTLRAGARFDDELLAYDGQRVNIIGFMVPLNQFRDISDFLLLPVPIECYFCGIPPARDVLYVRMAPGETVNLVKEPVFVSGTLNLHGEAGTKFFYSIDNAGRDAGERGGDLTQKFLAPEHMTPQHSQDEIELLPGMEPPAPSSGS